MAISALLFVQSSLSTPTHEICAVCPRMRVAATALLRLLSDCACPVRSDSPRITALLLDRERVHDPIRCDNSSLDACRMSGAVHQRATSFGGRRAVPTRRTGVRERSALLPRRRRRRARKRRKRAARLGVPPPPAGSRTGRETPANTRLAPDSPHPPTHHPTCRRRPVLQRSRHAIPLLTSVRLSARSRAPINDRYSGRDAVAFRRRPYPFNDLETASWKSLSTVFTDFRRTCSRRTGPSSANSRTGKAHKRCSSRARTRAWCPI